MMALRRLLVSLACCLTCVSADGTGNRGIRKFIQVSDFHYDELYSEGSSTKNSCHNDGKYGSGASGSATGGGADRAAGRLGDWKCDSPQALIKSAVSQMHRVLPDPDFILWTGDNSPHDGDGQKSVTKNMRSIVKWIYREFGGGVKVIPALGNHDSYPKDSFQDMRVNKTGAREQYRGYTKDGALIDFIKKEADFFNEHCGYYAVRNSSMYDNMTQTFLVLNTNLYHPANLANVDKTDPCGQLKWLDTQLRKSADDERVFIVAHIPPGYFELFTEEPFFGDEAVTRKYLQIVGKRSYAKKIVAHFYGHTHTSSFRLFWDEPNRQKAGGGGGSGGSGDNEPVGVGFIAPSVTPLLYQGGVNPSFRVYEYDPENRKVLTFKQYYLALENLTDSVTADGNSSNKDQLNITLVEPGVDSQIGTAATDQETTKADRTQFDRKIKGGKNSSSSGSSRRRNNGKFLSLNKRAAGMENVARALDSLGQNEEDTEDDRFVTSNQDYDLTEDAEGDITTETTTDTTSENDETTIAPDAASSTSTPSGITNCTDCVSNTTEPQQNENTTEPSVTTLESDNVEEEVETTTTEEPAVTTTTVEPLSVDGQWDVAFDAREDLQISQLSVGQMYKAYNDMVNDREGNIFKTFYRDFTVLKDIGPCDERCHAQMMCVVTSFLNKALRDCMADKGFNFKPEDTDLPPPVTSSPLHPSASDVTSKDFPNWLFNGTSITTTTTTTTTGGSKTPVVPPPVTDNSVDVPEPITRAPPHVTAAAAEEEEAAAAAAADSSSSSFPSASVQALAVFLALAFVVLVGGVSFWYYRRIRINRYRSQEFLLTDSVFKYDGYSQLDQP